MSVTSVYKQEAPKRYFQERETVCRFSYWGAVSEQPSPTQSIDSLKDGALWSKDEGLSSHDTIYYFIFLSYLCLYF